MSFEFLPIPYYLLMMLVGLIVLIRYVVKVWNQENKILLVGLLIISFSALGTSASRIIKETGYYGSIYSIVTKLTFYSAFLSAILIIIGGLKKVKNDPYRKRMVIIILVFFSVTIALLVVPVLYTIY